MVAFLRFKPVASEVHVRSVNAQANLMRNSCHGDMIWHRKSLRSFLPQALHGLCAASVTLRFLVSPIICKSCSKIWAYTAMYTGIFRQLQHTTQMNHTSQNHFWSLKHRIWNLAHITYFEAQTSHPYHKKVTMGWPPGNVTLLLLYHSTIGWFIPRTHLNSFEKRKNLWPLLVLNHDAQSIAHSRGAKIFHKPRSQLKIVGTEAWHA
jgi:hypothetical protein